MDKMTVRMPVTIKAKVTETLKTKIIGDLQKRIQPRSNIHITHTDITHNNPEKGQPKGSQNKTDKTAIDSARPVSECVCRVSAESFV